MSILNIKDLTFSYSSQTVLENINLDVKEYDFLAIIGPNGGGKSTLLKLILGLEETNQGIIKLASTVGYVPQNTNINIDFPITVLEVVMMGHVDGKRPLFGYSKSETMCAMGALEQVGMGKYAHSKIGSLSGGQRQRVMIARALCAHPKLLILDEPTSSIDIAGQRDIYELLKVLNKSITIIVVSHDISVILEYATAAAHINKTLSFHDISDKNHIFHTHNQDEHFCEVELLQMLGSDECKSCS